MPQKKDRKAGKPKVSPATPSSSKKAGKVGKERKEGKRKRRKTGSRCDGFRSKRARRPQERSGKVPETNGRICTRS
jgi:hypothetical protein